MYCCMGIKKVGRDSFVLFSGKKLKFGDPVFVFSNKGIRMGVFEKNKLSFIGKILARLKK